MSLLFQTVYHRVFLRGAGVLGAVGGALYVSGAVFDLHEDRFVVRISHTLLVRLSTSSLCFFFNFFFFLLLFLMFSFFFPFSNYADWICD